MRPSCLRGHRASIGNRPLYRCRAAMFGWAHAGACYDSPPTHPEMDHSGHAPSLCDRLLTPAAIWKMYLSFSDVQSCCKPPPAVWHHRELPASPWGASGATDWHSWHTKCRRYLQSSAFYLDCTSNTLFTDGVPFWHRNCFTLPDA